MSAELKDIKNLISTPEKWCKGSFARNTSNIPVGENSESACKWCLVGALFKICGHSKNSAEIHGIILNEIKDLEHVTVSRFNDHVDTTHETVMNLLDAFIVKSPSN